MTKKYTKPFVVLDMFDDLKKGNIINSKTCYLKYGISESTFYRYINDIRDYMWEKHLQEVVFDSHGNTYRIG